MRQSIVLSIFLTMATVNFLTAQSHALDFKKVKNFEHQLDDVMEIIDTIELKLKLKEVIQDYEKTPTQINKTRLGIIYHEVALNLSFFSKTEYKGFAKKSYDNLSEQFNSDSTSKELMPFIAAYRASALALVGSETRQLKLLGESFKLFESAVNNYASVSYLPEFLRGSVAENLPWFFFSKRKFAKTDFQSIINKQEMNDNFANWKIMSFTYWAWAKQREGGKFREKSLYYLDKAIALDPNYKAGRRRAETLKSTLK